jgi:hypothetical protein
MPADRGLPGLGLMMQWWAGLDGLAHVAAGIGALLIAPGDFGVPMAVMSCAGAVRALAHWIAGAELRTSSLRVLSVARLFLYTSVVAALVSVGVFWFAFEGLAFDGWTLGLVAGDAIAWPAVLVILLHRPSLRRLFARLAEGEEVIVDRNRGLEATGAIMTALGLSGFGFSAIALLVGNFAIAGDDGIAFWIELGIGVFGLRTLVLAILGIRTLMGADPSAFSRSARLYLLVHVATVIVLVIPMVMVIMEMSAGDDPFAGHDQPPIAIAMAVGMLAWLGMLSLLPLLLVQQAKRVEAAKEDGPAFARAPDGALATLGWFLCAYAAASLTNAIAALVFDSAYAMVKSGEVSIPMWFTDADLPVWTGLAGAAITLWLGIELIRLTSRARLAALTFAGITSAFAIYSHLDVLGGLWQYRGSFDAVMGLGTALEGGTMLMSLAVPAVAIVLAARKLPERSTV